jgi:hypothetical protein
MRDLDAGFEITGYDFENLEDVIVPEQSKTEVEGIPKSTPSSKSVVDQAMFGQGGQDHDTMASLRDVRKGGRVRLPPPPGEDSSEDTVATSGTTKDRLAAAERALLRMSNTDTDSLASESTTMTKQERMERLENVIKQLQQQQSVLQGQSDQSGQEASVKASVDQGGTPPLNNSSVAGTPPRGAGADG